MKTTKFQRITALALALVFVLCGGIGISAADASSSTSQISEIKELLNSVSYNAYLEEHKDVPIDLRSGIGFDRNTVHICSSEILLRSSSNAIASARSFSVAPLAFLCPPPPYFVATGLML